MITIDGTIARDSFRDQAALLGGRTDPLVFDIGAHIGQSINEYRKAFFAATIFSFEPTPESCREIERKFGADPRVHLVPLAVTDHIGTAKLNRNENGGINSLLPFGGVRPLYEGAFLKDKVGRYLDPLEVTVTTLDHFVSEMEIAHVDILKIDVQGEEVRAFRGAAKLFERQAVSLVFCEVNFIPMYDGSALYHDVAALLAEYGYTIYNLYDFHYAPNGQLRFANAIFVSPELRRSRVDPPPDVVREYTGPSKTVRTSGSALPDNERSKE